MNISYDAKSGKYIAMADGRVIRKSKHKGYCEKALSELQLFRGSQSEETVEKSEFSVSERFSFIQNFVELIAKNKLNSFILTGDGGLGKSYSVTNTLNKMGLIEDSIDDFGDYIVCKGFSTDKALYRLLFENNGKIIVFDDLDNILKSPISQNLLKAALSDEQRRIISWNAEFSNNEDLPNRFEFTGRCIFISNMSIEQFPQALISRSFCVDLTLSQEEKLERIVEVFKEYKSEFQDEVIEFLSKNLNNIKDLNIRSALNALKLRKDIGPNFERIALYSMSL